MIRQFDVYAPEAEKESRIRFNKETRCVTSMFERFYTPNKETGKSWKINVDVVPQVTRPSTTLMLGTLNIQVEGDIADYFMAEELQKKRLTLDYLMKGIIKVANELKFDMQQFIDPYNKIIECGFINTWIFKKPVKNKIKSLSAELLVEHTLDHADLSVVIKNKQGEILKIKHLISTFPDEFCFHKYLGKLVWVSDNLVELNWRQDAGKFSIEVSGLEEMN